MRDFFLGHGARFNARVAANSLVSKGLAYRVGDDEFVVYLSSPGSVALNLAGVPGSFQVEAVNLRNGSVSTLPDVVGNATVDLATPASGDEWAIRVFR